MSQNWVDDMWHMHDKFGVHEAVEKFDAEKLKKFLEFRINFLQEELDELKSAKSADDAVDALIDLSVIAIGTLDLFGVDAHLAWNRVYAANISKKIGVKASRPNPLGLPDLIKPTLETHGHEWVAPTHADNVGMLSKVYDE